MFNKAERARREAAQKYHDRCYRAEINITPDNKLAFFHDGALLAAANARARFHRKQAELWAKSVKAFDCAALRTMKMVGRK